VSSGAPGSHPGQPAAGPKHVVRDRDSDRWLRELGAARDAAVARLHDLLLRVARSEAARRRSTLPDRVGEPRS
jgi:hypothetical protein